MMDQVKIKKAIEWAEHMGNIFDSNLKYAQSDVEFKKIHDECLVHKSCLSVLKSCAEEMLVEKAI